MAILIGSGIKEDQVKNMVTVPALLAPSFNSLPSVLAAVNQQLAKYWRPAAEPPAQSCRASDARARHGKGGPAVGGGGDGGHHIRQWNLVPTMVPT